MQIFRTIQNLLISERSEEFFQNSIPHGREHNELLSLIFEDLRLLES